MKKTLVVIAVLALQSAAADAIPRTVTRTGPTGLPCPVGRSLNAGDPVAFPNSDPAVPNSGAYEFSFVAGPCGRAQVEIETVRSSTAQNMLESYLDNFIVIERNALFDPAIPISMEIMPGDLTCYKSSTPLVFPDMAAPMFDQMTIGGFPLGESFPGPAYAVPAGWTLVNAEVTSDYSATDIVVTTANIIDECTMGSCPTGSLRMGVTADIPSRVSFEVGGLVPGETYSLVFWWNIEPTQELTVDITGCQAIEVPTLGPSGLGIIFLLLAGVGVTLLRRRIA